jgi:PadR family transcriptional regulator, regulatory protein AphA
MSSADSEFRLSPTSYTVLGCVSLFGGEATPYTIQRFVSDTIGPFRPFPHSRLYAEADRLAEAAYLTLRQEEGGRRRKIYKLTRKGRTALREWRAEPVGEPFEVDDPAIVKVLFGANAGALAENQIEVLRTEIRRAEGVKKRWEPVAPEGPMLAADYSIAIRRAVLAFWSELARARRP